MIVKFNPQGMVKMVLGRKPEAIDFLERFLERGERNESAVPGRHAPAPSAGRPT